MNYWMLTISEENLEATRKKNWKQQGFTTRQRKKVDRMESGDRILFYVRDSRQFSATATMTSSSFEESTPVWKETGTGELFPHRVSLRPTVVLPKTSGLEGHHIAPRPRHPRYTETKPNTTRKYTARTFPPLRGAPIGPPPSTGAANTRLDQFSKGVFWKRLSAAAHRGKVNVVSMMRKPVCLDSLEWSKILDTDEIMLDTII